MTTRAKLFAAFALAGASFAFVAPALAQTAPENGLFCSQIYRGYSTPHSCTYAVTSSVDAGGAGITINNGRVDNGSSAPYAYGGGSNSSSWSDGGWINHAEALSGAGSAALGTANLSDGTVHGAMAVGSSAGNSQVLAEIGDNVTFTNTSGSAMTFNIGFAFDGKFSGVVTKMQDIYARAAWAAVGLTLTSNDIVYASSGNVLRVSGEAWIDGAGGSFFTDPGVAYSSYSTEAGAFTFTGGIGADGFASGAFNTSVIIPVGQSTLGLGLWLRGGCQQANSSCDFGNTGTLTFDALPAGLSFTSESGTLFSALDAGGVPEPASWALLIFGFGAVGAAMRRRRGPASVLA